jgi:hypothetical protein
VLVLEGVVSQEVNAAALGHIDELHRTWRSPNRPHPPVVGGPWTETYPPGTPLHAVLHTPKVAGAVHSLVGADAAYDDDYAHIRAPGEPGQSLHVDTVIDSGLPFDIQLFYFPTSIASEDGGTGYVPGSHLRLAHESEVACYQHLRGERHWAGSAGSVLIFHHRIWHRARPNRGTSNRTMAKVRLNPQSPQAGLGLGARTSELGRSELSDWELSDRFWRREPWMSQGDHRLDVVNRVRLWRYLSGRSDFDVEARFLDRIERRSALERS